MDLLLFLAADYATVDASGKLNILGAFNTIKAAQYPTQHQLMHLVVRLQPAYGEYGDTRQLRIVLVDEDGTELVQVAGDFELPKVKGGERPEFNAVIALRDLVFPHPGKYEFRLYIDKDQKRELPIRLVQIEQPQES